MMTLERVHAGEGSSPGLVGNRTLEVARPPRASAGSARVPVVLVVDDDADSREMYSEFLGFVGCRVLVALNGEEALALALETKPDVILMDISMPLMDGLEATRRLRADPSTATIPIVALTAFGAPYKDDARQAGCAVFLEKPTSLKQISSVVKSLIGGAEPARS